MTLQDRLEQAGAAAARLAGDDESVEAVLPAQPGTGGMLFLIAYGRDGDLSYLALDDDHRPVADRRQVRDAVAMLALVERAEEASGAVEAHRLAQAFTESAEALRVAGMPAEAAAAGGRGRQGGAAGRHRRAAAGGDARIPGPARRHRRGAARSAGRPRCAARRRRQRDAADIAAARAARGRLAGGRAGPLGRARRRISRVPLADTTGAVEALADDVVERYRVPLV